MDWVFGRGVVWYVWMGWTQQFHKNPPHPHARSNTQYTTQQQVNTFTANYRGEPFMQALWDNRPLRIFTLGLYGTLLALALELVPPANAYLQVGAFIEYDVGSLY